MKIFGSWARLIGALAALGLGCALASCFLLVDSKQCATNRDCVAKGAAFVDTTCSAGVCLEADKRDAGVSEPCTSTRECIAAHGAHSVCLSGATRRCATLTSQDCTQVLGDELRDNPLLMGLLLDTEQASSDSLVAGVALAVNDFEQAISGVPAVGGEPPRALVLVVCAEQDDVLRAARHLVEDLAVPAIIGPGDSTRLLELAEQLTVKSGTLLVSPAAGSYRISDLDDQGLVFRTTAPDTLEGHVMGLVAAGLSSVNAHVVSITTENDRGRGLRRGLDGSLGGADVKLSLPQTPDARALAQVVSQTVDASPEVVVLAGDAEAGLIADIERAWLSGARPQYVVFAGATSASFLEALSSAKAKQLSRVRAVFPDNRRSPLFQMFRLMLNSATAGTHNYLDAAKGYDALYLSGLAAIPALAAAGDNAVSGRDMAEAIPRLLQRGDHVDARVRELASAAARLHVQSVIDLEGASGPLDFDSRGDPETGFAVACVQRTTDGLLELTPTEADYRAGTNAAAGALRAMPMPCPRPGASTVAAELPLMVRTEPPGAQPASD